MLSPLSQPFPLPSQAVLPPITSKCSQLKIITGDLKRLLKNLPVTPQPVNTHSSERARESGAKYPRELHLPTHLCLHPPMPPCMHSCIYLPIYSCMYHLFIHISTHQSIHTCTHLSIYLPYICLTIYSWMYPSIYSFIYPPIHSYTHPSIHSPTLYLPTNLFMPTSIYIFIHASTH